MNTTQTQSVTVTDTAGNTYQGTIRNTKEVRHALNAGSANIVVLLSDDQTALFVHPSRITINA